MSAGMEDHAMSAAWKIAPCPQVSKFKRRSIQSKPAGRSFASKFSRRARVLFSFFRRELVGALSEGDELRHLHIGVAYETGMSQWNRLVL